MNYRVLWSKSHVTQRDLVKTGKQSPWSFWYQGGKSAQGTVAQRKALGHTLAHVERKHLIKQDSSVYAIGSCFARNIEEHLAARKIRVLSQEIDLPDDIYSVPARPNAILNQYSTPAMMSLLSEKEGVLDPVEISKKSYAIPCASAIRLVDKQTAGKIVQSLKSNYAKISSADCVIPTFESTSPPAPDINHAVGPVMATTVASGLLGRGYRPGSSGCR